MAARRLGVLVLVLVASSAAPAVAPGARAAARTPAEVTRLFVHEAVQRRDPGRAWGIVAASLKADTTRTEWNAGWLRVVPVLWPTPLHVRIRPLQRHPSSLLMRVGLSGDVRSPAAQGSFLIRLVRRDGGWLVSYWGPATTFSAPRG
jgi:hypothetical protein